MYVEITEPLGFYGSGFVGSNPDFDVRGLASMSIIVWNAPGPNFLIYTVTLYRNAEPTVIFAVD